MRGWRESSHSERFSAGRAASTAITSNASFSSISGEESRGSSDSNAAHAAATARASCRGGIAATHFLNDSAIQMHLKYERPCDE
jgi:hypothetical protein